MARWWIPLVGLVILIAGCSDNVADPLAAPERESTATTSPADNEATAETSTSTTAANQTEPSSESPTAAADAEVPPPIEPFDAPDSEELVGNDTTAWISRRVMNASEIELVWSAPQGAATYEVHRLARVSEIPPPFQDMTVDNRIHVAAHNGTFLDDGVTEDAAYWYGIRGLDVDGNVMSVGWHQAVAVTDEEPPSPVVLSLQETSDAIALSWEQPEENFELHGYRIFRSVDNQEPETLATTWNIDQTTFIDNAAPAGNVTYLVEAFDFHWNKSERSEVSIDIS